MDVRLKIGHSLKLPEKVEELALYPLSGHLQIGDTTYEPQQLLALHPKASHAVKAIDDCHFMVFGGAAMDGPRLIWWNFVASTPEQLEEAKRDWLLGRFPEVPGDHEFIPLPG